MIKHVPTDSDICQALAVILFDPRNTWQEPIGPVRAGLPSSEGMPATEAGFQLRIPVDSTAADIIDNWRNRIHRLLDNGLKH